MPSKLLKGWDREVRIGECGDSAVDIGPIRTLEDLRKRTAEESYQAHINGAEDRDILDGDAFSRVGANKLRCRYCVIGCSGRAKGVSFTVTFSPDSAAVVDSDTSES